MKEYFHSAAEPFSTITRVTTGFSTFQLNWLANSVYYFSSLSTNFRTNIVNTPETNNNSYVVVYNLIQGLTPYFCDSLLLNNSTVSIKWAGATTPSPAGSRVEIESFSFFYLNGWNALGQYTSFG